MVPIYVSFIVIKISYENYIQQEMSNQIIENIKRGEAEFYTAFQEMINISNMIALDKELILRLDDESVSYYDRNKRFDEIVNTLVINNQFNLNDTRITMFDTKNRNYANWSLFFNDYSFIMDEDWVNYSITNKWYISWSLFAPSFIQQENELYISLARSILNSAYTGTRIATLLVGINQKKISSILTKYDMNADFIRVCTRETAEDIFMMDQINITHASDLRSLLDETGGKASGGLICEQGGTRYLLSYYTLNFPWTFNGENLVVLYFTDYQHITDNLSSRSRAINYRMILFLFILIVITGIIAYTIGRPIRILDKKVNQYTQTRQINIFNTKRRDEIGDLNRTFLDMEIRINDLFDKLRQESEIREQYHFQALRAQINPHFLFNTLNTIRWMALIRKADNITDAVNSLVKMLEYSISGNRELVPLMEELDMIRNYMHIQNYRYGEDYEVCIDIPDELGEYRIIKFILQPIVENAFQHAFKNTAHKKIIRITGHAGESCLKLFVQDNGDGVDSRTVDELNERLNRLDRQIEQKDRTGIGLINVHERIRVEYGEAFGLCFFL
jgi:two-component system sensor histidine kinase YesM